MLFRINNWNINILFFSNYHKSSQICGKYGSEDVYIVGKWVKVRFKSELSIVNVRGRTAAVLNSAPYTGQRYLSTGLWLPVD